MMNKKKTSPAGLSKYALALPILALLLMMAYACKNKQDSGTVQEPSAIVNKTAEVKDKPLTSVEQMPLFPGGEEALIKFFRDNIHYPTSAALAKTEGRVIIRFVVRKTGNVTDVEVLRSLDPACDKEAVRIVKMMPKWIPGKQSGQNVSTYFVVPIVFKLQE